MTVPGLAQRFAVETNGISADTIDNEVVIVNLKSGFYYSLTELGAEIWSYVQAQLSLGQMIDTVLARYDADRASVREWLTRLLTELEGEALIARTDLAPSVEIAIAPMRTASGTPAPVAVPMLKKYTDLRDVVLLSAVP